MNAEHDSRTGAEPRSRGWLRHLPRSNSKRAALAALHERDALMRALFTATAELAEATEEDAVFSHLCRSLVDASSHLKLAWCWSGAANAAEVRPLVGAGAALQYAKQLVIERGWATRRGAVLRALDACVTDAALAFRPAPYTPWLNAKRRFGFSSALALPIRLPDVNRSAVLVVYAENADYFKRVGVTPFVAFAHLAESALARAQHQTELRSLIERDPLTGLPDRRGADVHFTQAWRKLREHQTFSLLMIDVDQFDQINHRLGRGTGDRVLRDVGLAIGAALRGHDKLVRWNGDAFVALLPGASAGTARRVAERVQYAVLERGWQTGVPRLSCSIGVVSGPERFVDWESMVAHVDTAMQASRTAGRDRLVVA